MGPELRASPKTTTRLEPRLLGVEPSTRKKKATTSPTVYQTVRVHSGGDVSLNQQLKMSLFW